MVYGDVTSTGGGNDFAVRLRSREELVGYWIMMDSPSSTERIARLGYDFVCLDGQHGLLGYEGILRGLTAIDAGAHRSPNPPAAGVVRVASRDAVVIAQALDAGAAAVIVPVVDDAQQARDAVAAARYAGSRSYGPMRSGLRIGPRPADADRDTAVLMMIETRAGLDAVDEIAAVPGVDGLHVGPADLALSLGAAYVGDPDIADELETALVRIVAAAERNGIACGYHVSDGDAARQRVKTGGFTYATVSSDLTHLEGIAARHLAAARQRG